MAGLAYMYDTGNFYLLVKTRDEEFGNQNLDLKRPAKLRLIKSDHFDVTDAIPEIDIPEDEPLFLTGCDYPGGAICEILLLIGWKRV